MERIKLAIEKARESADQLERGQGRATAGGAVPSSREPASAASLRSTRARAAGGPTTTGRFVRTLAPLLLAGLAVAGGLWFMRDSGPGPAPAAATEQGSAAPASVPQLAAAVSAPPVAEPASPSAAIKSVPAADTGSGAAPAGPDAAKPPVVLAAQVEAAVEAWRAAWSQRDMVNYLDAYSGTFAPADGMSRQDWLASRYRNVGGRPSIEVGIRNVNVAELSPARARVSFVQDYASGSVRETGQPKTLDLALEADGRWRIVGEWSGKAPPLR